MRFGSPDIHARRGGSMRYDRLFVFVAPLALLLMPLGQFVPLLGSLAELAQVLILCFILVRAFLGGAIRVDWLYVLGFVGISIFLSFVFGVKRPYSSVILQGFIFVKFFFFYFFIADLVARRQLSLSALYKALKIVFMLTIASGVINILWGHGYYSFFNVKTDYRLGGLLPRVGGFQLQPNAFAQTLYAFAFALVIVYDGFSKKIVALILTAFAFILLSGSRTGLFALILVLTAFFVFSRASHVSLRFAKVAFLLVFGFLLIVLSSDTWLVEKTLGNFEGISSKDESGYIRGIMLYEGVRGALERFPFGWGLATFGTSMSVDSPVWWDVGLANTRFVLEERGIYDSNLASITGELGFLGVAFCLLMIWRVAGPASSDGHAVPSRAYVPALMSMLILFVVSSALVNDYLSLLMAIVMVFVRYRYLLVDMSFYEGRR